MDEMHAIEERIAREMVRRAGPSEPVDDLAIYEAVTAASRHEGRGFTVFSALKLAAAGVIVALFGGFLLAGILPTLQGDETAPAAVTHSPSPMTTDDILPGVTLTIEEVEPGVFRVTNDGVRDLASVDVTDLVAGYDDGIWLLREDEFLRLGSGGTHQWPAESASYDGRIFEVAPGGTMWITAPRYPLIPGSRGGDTLGSADGEEWVPLPCPRPCSVCPARCAGVTVAPDGEVWASWPDEGAIRWRVGHLGPAGWEPLDGYIPGDFSGGFYRLYLTDAGDIYGVAPGYVGILYRYEDGTWSRVADLGLAPVVDVGRDGTVWQTGSAYLYGARPTERQQVLDGSWPQLGAGLARFAGGVWTVWTPSDVPGLDLPSRPDDDEFGVGPDGSLWAGTRCDGLVRFDGITTDRFLSGQCISMDIAADGTVWALAGNNEAGGRDLYVITLAAVGASTDG